MLRYKGIGATKRIAIGRVFRVPGTGVLHREDAADEILFSAEKEIEKLTNALEKSRQQIRDILQKIRNANPNDKSIDIIATQLDYFDDPSFNDDAVVLITSQRLGAAEAVRRQTRELCDTFNSFEDDPYMRERAADITDAGERIFNNISGFCADIPRTLPPDTVVVAHDLVPSQTAQLDLDHVLGFVTEAGGLTSHTAIMAHSMNIAAVVGCQDLLDKACDGDSIIVDAGKGLVVLRPDEVNLRTYEKLQAKDKVVWKSYDQVKYRRILRSGGGEILVAANIGSSREAELAKEQGANGVGLFRTEFLFLSRNEMPGEDEQYEAYRAVAKVFGDAPVTIRTLDIGGDKELPYLKIPREENPFLGMRAIRLCLHYPDIFKTQLRAILRAAVHGNLQIMFPLICRMEELKEARTLLQECMAALEEDGIPYKKDIAVGMMIETPATAILAREFAKEVDFFSIGTNDLTQYTLVVDRGNPLLSGLYDTMNPAVLRLIKFTIEAAHEVNITCCVCGEFAADPQALPLLVEYGLDEFSVGIDTIAETKAGLLGLVGLSAE
ncbi:MAG: phosphoenolpyruvate--protein phosphotransferase [Treponema sp.]|jgi:phosphotransferase system enzyme I (PtsI)|nr:phosphoenolpyruvate--protein phosphotransferase [Treponema sp.]